MIVIISLSILVVVTAGFLYHTVRSTDRSLHEAQQRLRAAEAAREALLDDLRDALTGATDTDWAEVGRRKRSARTGPDWDEAEQMLDRTLTRMLDEAYRRAERDDRRRQVLDWQEAWKDAEAHVILARKDHREARFAFDQMTSTFPTDTVCRVLGVDERQDVTK